jgi:molybdate transport system substrate-binding protein
MKIAIGAKASLAALTLGLIVGGAPALAQSAPPVTIADAKPGEVRVLVTNGMRYAFEAVRAQAAKAVGKPLVVQYGNVRALRSLIESGQPFELVLVTRQFADDMAEKTFILPRGRVNVGRVPVAVFQRGDGPARDVSTLEALKVTLLGATSIRYMATGPAGPTINKTFAALGVGEALKGRLREPGSALVELAPGQYELVITLASELDPRAGRIYLGNIPGTLQTPVWMSAGVGAHGDTRSGRALAAFLGGPMAKPTLKAHHVSR